MKFGYPDKKGRDSRFNFGGVHKFGITHSTTGLKLTLDGFDVESGKILKSDGSICLLDKNGNSAASWSFATLLKHWNTKHANACYVPSQMQKLANSDSGTRQQYFYGNNILLGEGTDFILLLKQIANGNIYYDPGIKLELEIAGVRPKLIKKRSQFRIKSGNLRNLYKHTELYTLDSDDNDTQKGK
jgi:hypothetical protein